MRYFSDIAGYDNDRLLNNVDFIVQPAAFWKKQASIQCSLFKHQRHLCYLENNLFWYPVPDNLESFNAATEDYAMLIDSYSEKRYLKQLSVY